MEQQEKKELPACPVETTLTLIGDKWKVLILRDLLPGTKRFGELKKSIGHVSQKVLTAQLRDMEQSRLVHREVFAEVPPRVEYSLTDLGRTHCGLGGRGTKLAWRKNSLFLPEQRDCTKPAPPSLGLAKRVQTRPAIFSILWWRLPPPPDLYWLFPFFPNRCHPLQHPKRTRVRPFWAFPGALRCFCPLFTCKVFVPFFVRSAANKSH